MSREAITGFLEASRGMHYWPPDLDDAMWHQTVEAFHSGLKRFPAVFSAEAMEWAIQTRTERPSVGIVQMRAQKRIDQATMHIDRELWGERAAEERAEAEERRLRHEREWPPEAHERADGLVAQLFAEWGVRRPGQDEIGSRRGVPNPDGFTLPWGLNNTKEDADVAAIIDFHGLPQTVQQWRSLQGLSSIADRRLARAQLRHPGGVKGWIRAQRERASA